MVNGAINISTAAKELYLKNTLYVIDYKFSKWFPIPITNTNQRSPQTMQLSHNEISR